MSMLADTNVQNPRRVLCKKTCVNKVLVWTEGTWACPNISLPQDGLMPIWKPWPHLSLSFSLPWPISPLSDLSPRSSLQASLSQSWLSDKARFEVVTVYTKLNVRIGCWLGSELLDWDWVWDYIGKIPIPIMPTSTWNILWKSFIEWRASSRIDFPIYQRKYTDYFL